MFQVPSGKVARGVVEAPASKSHAIRLLVVGALCPGGAEIGRVGAADDLRHVMDALAALRRAGAGQKSGRFHDVAMSGARTPHPRASDVARVGEHAASYGTVVDACLDLGGSATGLRLLTAACSLEAGRFVLDGDESLRARPVGAVLDALRALGVEGRALGPDGGLPVEISGPPRGGSRVSVDGTRSSQGVSALLILGPALRGGLVVDVSGPLVSAPYVDLTIQVIRAAGGTVTVSGDDRSPTYAVAGEYGRLSAVVEGDWSGAAYPLAAAAATGGDVTVRGLQVGSAQADRRIGDVLRSFGAEVEFGQETIRASGRIQHPVDVDLADAPDLGPLVGALACLAPGRSRVRGAAHLRIKESDRIAATVSAARALGFQAEEHEDGFSVLGGERSAASRAVVDSRGDHRIAMSFGVAGLALEGVEISRPECVAKTYPEFWSDLTGLLEA